MLDKMRQQSQSAIILLLFGFIIFVFVFSFGAGSEGFRSGGCGRAGIAALVNGEGISDMHFQFHYDQQLRMALSQKKQGSFLRREDKLALRQQVMQTLVDQALLLQAAQRIGLHVTDEERNQSIRSSPQFMDDNQRFNFKMYKMVVQRYYQTTMKLFEEVWRDQMLAQRMAQIVMDTARVTDEELNQAYVMRETKVDLAFVRVPASMYIKDAVPVEKDIQEFLKNQTGRVEAFYNSHSDRYHKPKKVQVAHVFFEVRKEYDEEQVTDKREQAELTVDDLKKGADFTKQAKDYSEDDATREKGGGLPMLTLDAMTARWGAPFAEAAFELEPDGTSEVVKSDKGYHVIKCQKIVAAEDHPLEEVKAEIAKEILTDDRANQKAKAEAQRLQAGIKQGKQLEELAPPQPETADRKPTKGLHTQQTGKIARMGGFVPPIGIDEDLARAVFELTKEKPIPDKVFELAPPAGLGRPSYVVVQLKERVEPDMTAFPEAKSALTNQFLANRRQGQLAAWLQHQNKTGQIEVNQAFLVDVANPGQRRGQ
jgi:peptidyl-prolyl cis-trans isomerase D